MFFFSLLLILVTHPDLIKQEVCTIAVNLDSRNNIGLFGLFTKYRVIYELTHQEDFLKVFRGHSVLNTLNNDCLWLSGLKLGKQGQVIFQHYYHTGDIPLTDMIITIKCPSGTWLTSLQWRQKLNEYSYRYMYFHHVICKRGDHLEYVHAVIFLCIRSI